MPLQNGLIPRKRSIVVSRIRLRDRHFAPHRLSSCFKPAEDSSFLPTLYLSFFFLFLFFLCAAFLRTSQEHSACVLLYS
jgi:hypothetical protein